MNSKFYKSYFFRILIILFFILSSLNATENIDFKSRISFLNIGIDINNHFNLDNFHRSILIVPVFYERNDMGFGIYVNPFIKTDNNDLGYESFSPLIDSYLVNFRFRYFKPLSKDVKLSFDLAYSDGNVYNWKDIVISWFEFGFNYKLSYSTQLFLGYKYILNSNDSSIDFNGVHFNLIFGHSFLRR